MLNKVMFVLSLLFVLVQQSYAADYNECKSFCADKFRECIRDHKDISPESCAEISNNCLDQCKKIFHKSSLSFPNDSKMGANDSMMNTSCSGDVVTRRGAGFF